MLAFHHDRQRARLLGLRDEVMAVDVIARNREEEMPVAHRAGVVGEAAHLAHREAHHPFGGDDIGQFA